MTDKEVADALLTVADDKLLPVLWRLSWLEARLPAGRSRDVVEASRLEVERARGRMLEEATALTRPHSDVDDLPKVGAPCSVCRNPIGEYEVNRDLFAHVECM